MFGPVADRQTQPSLRKAGMRVFMRSGESVETSCSSGLPRQAQPWPAPLAALPKDCGSFPFGKFE